MFPLSTIDSGNKICHKNSEKTTFNVIIGLTASVACIKTKELVQEINTLFSDNKILVNLKLVPTNNALFFISHEELLKLAPTIIDNEEWLSWSQKGDPVLHIELRKWADAFLIAPLDANTMAKLSYGLCDNLLTCVARAWDFKNPIFVAPAMNTFMWDHPHTKKHLDILNELNINIINPVAKKLACGDYGVGAMASPKDIAQTVFNYLLGRESTLN
ncbi:hypothetical protein BB561_005018 [Smittium simulii]|uniref:Flavoprotein domain-containing protein n=1 Tax=Smittium simulii TaxID=133385 RepID=A0A2T9YCQ7_9FUNG|nr:hypothetical protein BB561_005018 [Smittium simulii]